MGAWNAKLYSSDTAADIRDDYVDQLKRGRENDQMTSELINQNQDILCDEEEAAEFWFALADTQWRYGRLLPVVKENALKYLDRKEHLERWKEAGIEKYEARLQVLNDLKFKLLSPMPPKKKVSQYKLYKCEWNIGDVFAYKFNSEYSSIKGFEDRYILLRKVGEETWWPGHIVPVVHIYKWIGDVLPNISFVENLTLLPQFFKPTVYKNINDDEILYRLVLLSTSRRVIPHNNLFFIGNLQSNENLSKPKRERTESYQCNWKDFEEYTIDNYLNWENVDIY